MNADRVIKSDAEFFKTGTWAGGTWRRNTILARGDNVQAVKGSNSMEWNPADTGNCPKTTDPQSAGFRDDAHAAGCAGTGSSGSGGSVPGYGRRVVH